jgi:hypothetical protein
MRAQGTCVVGRHKFGGVDWFHWQDAGNEEARPNTNKYPVRVAITIRHLHAQTSLTNNSRSDHFEELRSASKERYVSVRGTMLITDR